MPRKHEKRPYKPRHSQLCEHCGNIIIQFATHNRICVENPDIKGRLLRFLHDHAVDGHLMQWTDYAAQHKEHSFPGPTCLRDQFDTWDGVAAWAGLLPALRYARHLVDRSDADNINSPLPENFRLFHLPLEKADQPEGLPVYKALRLVRAWDVKGHCYQPIGWERVWAVR